MSCSTAVRSELKVVVTRFVIKIIEAFVLFVTWLFVLFTGLFLLKTAVRK